MTKYLFILLIAAFSVSCLKFEKPSKILSSSVSVDRDFFEVDTLNLGGFWSELWVLDIEPAQGVVILLHSGEKNALFWKEAQRLYKNGYSVVVSHSPIPFEDLTTPSQHISNQTEWLNQLYTFTRNKLGNAQIHLYGFELGAQAILQAFPKLYPVPQSVIIHDACSDLPTLFYITNARKMEGYWKFWVKENLNSFEINPIQLLKHLNVPILFISGTNKNSIFKRQITELHNFYSGNKRLVQFSKSTHGSIAYTEADAWEYFVTNFLNNEEF